MMWNNTETTLLNLIDGKIYLVAVPMKIEPGGYWQAALTYHYAMQEWVCTLCYHPVVVPLKGTYWQELPASPDTTLAD